MNHQPRTEAALASYRMRLAVVALAATLGFAALGTRLWVLQVQRHEEMAERAESNRTAVVPIVPNRGDILDRNGVVLATSYKAEELDVLDRKIMQLEIEIEAIKRENDDEKLRLLNADLANLKEERNALFTKSVKIPIAGKES